MWWIGPQGPRYRIQRFISGVVLVIMACYLLGQIDAYCTGEGSLTDVLGGLFLMALGGGMFYMADKW